jgi:hypothetical protein
MTLEARYAAAATGIASTATLTLVALEKIGQKAYAKLRREEKKDDFCFKRAKAIPDDNCGIALD